MSTMKDVLKKLFAKEENIQRTDNFNNYYWPVKSVKHKKTVFSNKFISTTDGSETNWQLGMYTTEGSESMTLHITNFDDRDVSVEISLVIKNQLGKVVAEKTIVKQEFAKKYRRRIYETKIKTDPKVGLRNLSVFCKISVEDQTCKSSESREKLDDFIRDETTSDVIFKVENRSFYAHQKVLSRRSEVFKTMFQRTNHSVVEIRDVSAQVFLEFLRFMYTGEVRHFLSPRVATELLKVADKYGVSELRDVCQKLVIKNFMTSNPHLFDFELYHDDEKIDFKTKLWKWLVKVSRNILNEPHMERTFTESEPLLACEMYANRCVHLLQMNNCYNFY